MAKGEKLFRIVYSVPSLKLTAKAPKNGLEDQFPFGMAYFQVPC